MMGGGLYNQLERYFATHIEELRETANSLQGEALLQYYATWWDRYDNGSKRIDRLCSFLNRQWIKRERDEGRRNIHTVRVLILLQWKEIFLSSIQCKDQNLTAAFLCMVERQRNGETVDEDVLKKVVDSFITLDVDESNLCNVCYDLYDENIGTPFLESTEKYYQAESEAFLAEHTVSDYVRYAKTRLQDEEIHAARFLPNRTCSRLPSLVASHDPVICVSFRGFFEQGELDELGCLCALFVRIPESAQAWVGDRVRDAGLAAVAALVDAGDVDAIATQDYVGALVGTHERFWSRCKPHPDLVASFDKACVAFISRNAATGDSATKSSEMLVRHTDWLLRTAVKSGHDFEQALDQVMTLFKYLEDKDIFQHLYSVKLARRHLHSTSASEEAEAYMIARLAGACGVVYTQKLQRMLTDVPLSKKISDGFKARTTDALGLNFSIMVLGTSFWPLKTPEHPFIVPRALLSTYRRFQTYYQSRHSGRKLTWLWNYSKNELQTNFADQRYMLVASSYQMAVLVQYNDKDTISSGDLIAATSIPKNILTQILAGLVKTNLLIKEGDEYTLNLNFKSTKTRININQPVKAEPEPEISETIKQVVQDRQYVLQATIVRIMKVHKTMKNQELVQEVVSEVSQRFAPKIPNIKRAIEALVEREYIGRVEGAQDTFAYIA